MPFERPTLAAIVSRIDGDIVTRVTGAITILRRSVLKILGRAYAGACHLLYGNIEFNKDQTFITTANAEHLERHAAEYGITRTAATKATGTGTATGTDGITIPASTELQSTTGIVYLTDAAVVIASGVATLAITAKVAGEDGNDDSGIVLTFVSPISGVTTTVTTTTALDGGADEETDEALRERVLARKRQPPHGGASFDYEQWMLEVSGVTRSWAIDQYQGIGTIGCAFVRDNDDDLIPSPAEITTVENYILSHPDPITLVTVGKPVTAILYMITLTKKSVNLTLSISPNTADVQTAIESKIEDIILSEGGPGQTIYLSQISAAISAATGEDRHSIDFPTDDITASTNEVHVPGTITWNTYNG
jgi:uncharacterized phage protein gp47/JayE